MTRRIQDVRAVISGGVEVGFDFQCTGGLELGAVSFVLESMGR